MKLRFIAVCLMVLGISQALAADQDWSSWVTAHSSWTTLYKNKDVQYRWRAATANGSEECLLQLRDIKRQPNQTTVVNVQIDYQYHQAESSRDVVTIMDVKGENYGETTVHHCVSVGDLHVTDIARH
jgi:hypothetical protein